MTLTSTTNRVQYNGDGATVAFSVTFVFWSADDLRVILTDSSGTETVWTRGTQYTVSGGDGSTGTVTVDTSPTDYTPAAGETLTIKSSLSDTQNTSLPAGGEFPSTSVEEQLDKIVRQIQQKDEEIGRAPKLAETSSASDITFPDPSADKVIGWNTAGDDLENKTPNTDAFLGLPASATDNAIVRFDGTGGTSLQNSGVTISDDDDVAGVRDLTTTRAIVAGTDVTVGEDLIEPAYIDVASATTTDLGAVAGRYVRITGTTTITGLGTIEAGRVRHVRFAAALTLTHNATSLILEGGANITTAANDTCTFVSLGAGNWLSLGYKKADGTAVVSSSETTGSWTPVISFGAPGDLSVAYGAQTGTFIQIGNDVWATFNIVTSTFTHSTASGPLILTGLSAIGVTENVTDQQWHSEIHWGGITKASYTDVSGRLGAGSSTMDFVASGSGQASANVTASDMPSGGTVTLRGEIHFRIQ